MRCLVVDAEPGVRLVLRHLLEDRGWEVFEADGFDAASRMVEQFGPRMVFLDRTLPDGDGEALIQPLHEAGIAVVVMTTVGEVEQAARCMSQGAEYFFQKPLDLDHVLAIVARTEEKVRLRREAVAYRQLLDRQARLDPLVGVSEPLEEVKRLISLLAKNPTTPALIVGESGTGKELVARAVHDLGALTGPFVDVNCASLSENLLESELFGHEKGAFTDAREAKKGLLEIADRGTIFFDELTEMPLTVQAKLLRALETGQFRRVGGVRQVHSRVRVVAATNRDIEGVVAKGAFREDLYYRLHVFPIWVPPLRERTEDIPVLARHFAGVLGREMGVANQFLPEEVYAKLQAYWWPGNVRELRNVVERALILADGACPGPEHLPPEVRGGRGAATANGSGSGPVGEEALRPLDEVVSAHVARVMRCVEGNRSRAARVLGISRSTLLARLKKMEDNRAA